MAFRCSRGVTGRRPWSCSRPSGSRMGWCNCIIAFSRNPDVNVARPSCSWNGSKLPENPELVEVGPVLDDLSFFDAQEVYLRPGEFLSRGRNAEERRLALRFDVVAKDHERSFGHDVAHVNV